MANISEELHAAASIGEIDTIYKAIEQNPHILEVIDAEPFANTPLHTAVLAGCLEFSIEIMRLKPSFGWKLNKQGFSPIHLALQNNQHNVVRRLVEINKDLARVKGREGLTPLHVVCQCGDDEDNMALLIDLLEACPASVEDVNARNETALHVALINGNLRAFRVLFGWLTNNTRKGALLQERSILNWKDSGGNTILHIATLNDNLPAVDLLIGRVKINAKNLENQTALDIAEAHGLPVIERTLLKAKAKRGASVDDDDSKREDKLTKSKLPLLIKHHFIGTERTRTETSEEHRNACMVVATLVVTAIYQTVLSPPGGLTQPQGGSDNNNNLVNATSSVKYTFNTTITGAGKSVLRQSVFSVFTVLNTIIFVGGVLTILVTLPRALVAFRASIPLLLLYLSFVLSMIIISPA